MSALSSKNPVTAPRRSKWLTREPAGQWRSDQNRVSSFKMLKCITTTIMNIDYSGEKLYDEHHTFQLASFASGSSGPCAAQTARLIVTSAS